MLLAVIVVVAVSIPLGAASVAAQENETAAPATNETSSIVEEVDEDIRVESYRYDEDRETFLITLSSVGERPSAVTITEVIDPRSGGGTGTFGVEQVTVQPGETVEVEVSSRLTSGSAGVMIVTQKSIDRGQGTDLWYDKGSPIIEGGATWTDVRVGMSVGIVVTTIAFLIAAWYVIRHSRRADLEEVTI